MGLDMYLSAEKYVSRRSYVSDSNPEDTELFQEIVKATNSSGVVDPDGWAGITINIPVGYWRKANQIHGYFVQVWGNGIDECQPIHVPRAGLEDLLNICKVIIENKDDPEFDIMSTLPPTPGFFFGSYDIDDWYFEDIQNTIEIIERSLADQEQTSFIYQASW